MSDWREGADQVGHGEASLGEAQAANPPDDPEYIEADAGPLDADVELDPLDLDDSERDEEDPAPNAP